MKQAIITNIQRYSIHDGPGIRTVVFLKGCPLRCRWCSNPEGQEPYPEVLHDRERCVGCGACAEACPQHAITFDVEKKAEISRELCSRCMKCMPACLHGALETSGRPMDIDEIVENCLRDTPFYNRSGGGVTLSGGEPFYEGEFTLQLIAQLKKQGIHVAVETTGDVEISLLTRSKTDLFLFDFKAADQQLHMMVTGVDNRRIIKNLQTLIAAGREVLVRMPMIPGYNMAPDNIEKTGRLLAGAGARNVELLPYHPYGIAKYRMLSRPYFCADVREPAEEQLQKVREQLETFGLTCISGQHPVYQNL